MQPVRRQASRTTILGAMLIATAAGGAACGSSDKGDGASASSQQAVAQATPPPISSQPTAAQLTHGQNLWLKATFGGEQFFSVLLPEALGLNVGLSQVLLTPRSERFTQWGVVNDPNCTDGNALTGGLDICPPDVASSDLGRPVRGSAQRRRRSPRVPEPGVQLRRTGERDELAYPRRCRMRRLPRGAGRPEPAGGSQPPDLGEHRAHDGKSVHPDRENFRREPAANRPAMAGVQHLGAGHRGHDGHRERRHQQPRHHHPVLRFPGSPLLHGGAERSAAQRARRHRGAGASGRTRGRG